MGHKACVIRDAIVVLAPSWILVLLCSLGPAPSIRTAGELSDAHQHFASGALVLLAKSRGSRSTHGACGEPLLRVLVYRHRSYRCRHAPRVGHCMSFTHGAALRLEVFFCGR